MMLFVCTDRSTAIVKASPFHTMSDLNPYSLMSSDTSGAFLMHIKVCKTNYDQWSSAFLGAMKAKRKECSIDDTLKHQDRNSAEFAYWGAINSLIVSWIFVTLDHSLVLSIPCKDEVKEFWDLLKNQFFVGNRPKISELNGTLGNCKPQGETVIAYFS